MGRKKSTFEEFNSAAIRDGITYAEAQMRESRGMMEKIRAPRTEDGEPVFMKVSARNTLRNLDGAAGRRKGSVSWKS